MAVIAIAGLGLRLHYAVEQPFRQPPDAVAYQQIAENLYRDGSFDVRPPGVAHELQPTSSYSPGLPLLVAALYWLTGGVHPTLVLITLALVGSAAIPLTLLLGRQLAGPIAGLFAAGLLAFYPALLEYQGLLLTEPLAAFLLSAALLVFLRAVERPSLRPWLADGALLGLLALVRPEYLAIVVLLPLAWLVREWRQGRLRRAATLAGIALLGAVAVLVPWTVRNFIVLDRAVPVSTGGGKALYIGTYLDADGDGPKLRELLLAQRPRLRERLSQGGRLDDTSRQVLERVLAEVARTRYPDLETDAALGRMGRANLIDDVTERPAAFAGMLVDKAYETWTDAARRVMEREPWRAIQLGVVILALIGLATLAARRRFEAAVCGLLLAYMTAISALLIASPRRMLVMAPLLAALAGVGPAYIGCWLQEQRS